MNDGPLPVGAMHADELAVDAALARRLLRAQLPELADLPLAAVPSSGTVHVIYRVGDELAIRLPRVAGNGASLRKERRWVPRLAPLLPLEVPVPVHLGEATGEYPSPWLVCTWLEGHEATLEGLDDPRRDAAGLAAFTAALHGIGTEDGPGPGAHNGQKAEPLADRDDVTRSAIRSLAGELDAATALRAWDAALAAAPCGAPVWVHGDLHAPNLLVRDGSLRGVLDFGCLCVGDPAIDLLAAWSLFEGESRRAFRSATAADDAAWARGRGWALTLVVAVPYYRASNPVFAAVARHTVEAAIAEFDELA